MPPPLDIGSLDTALGLNWCVSCGAYLVEATLQIVERDLNDELKDSTPGSP